MLRILAVIFIIIFAFRAIASVFRFLFGASASERQRQTRGTRAGQQFKKKPADGNVNVDYVPDKNKDKDFGGGDYVDYEEVK